MSQGSAQPKVVQSPGEFVGRYGGKPPGGGPSKAGIGMPGRMGSAIPPEESRRRRRVLSGLLARAPSDGRHDPQKLREHRDEQQRCSNTLRTGNEKEHTQHRR